MAFNPRPQMGIAQMPAGMMSSGYAFTPMGMMPMSMGMMPPTTVMTPIGMNSSVITSQNKQRKGLVPQDISDKDEKKDEKPPVTTVFVGNISERAPDSMIKTMLVRCGNVLSWKRVQGASGKLQAFGFCEYEDPEATLRCMRLLNEWSIADRRLVVKVDAKTKTLLDEYRKRKREEDEEEEGKNKSEKEKNGDDKEEPEERKEKGDLDESTMREDRVAKAGLDAIMREYAFELAKEPSYSKSEREIVSDIPKVPMPPLRKKDESQLKDTGLVDLKIEDDKKEIINREIRSFRDLHKIRASRLVDPEYKLGINQSVCLSLIRGLSKILRTCSRKL